MNRKPLTVCAIAGVCFAALALQGLAGDEAAKPAAELPKCMMMPKNPVNLAVSAKTDAGPVYFCCARCATKYQQDPTKYADQAAAQHKALEGRARVQVACPVSGHPTDLDVSYDDGGNKVNFCCNDCVASYKADAAKYRAALVNCYSYQTKCPVEGGDIDPFANVDLKSGGKLYFCCSDCAAKFKAEPDKYVANLAAQGYQVKAADLAM